ncbi:MAG: hypothetical protein ABSG86_18890 [Thermoguttaceae bacterium]|jgi:hypothetical protein
MLDYQRITDDVRSALVNNGLDGEDFLQAAAADYSLAADEVNDRLRHCAAMLRKGLRGEAIRLCEIEPNLLDAVAVLDFPERNSWADLLQMRGLIPPAGLLVDLAAELNEAYAIEEPLAALMGRHRLLAMSRAPLSLRLQTLRQLAEADRDNPVWEKDIPAFEEERLKEIHHEVAQAIASGDAAALAALAGEVAIDIWRHRPPESLFVKITAARTDLARKEGLAEMRRVEGRLGEAHMAMDMQAGRELRGRWNQLLDAWRTAVSPETLDRVAPALEWLREQDELAAQEARHAAALAALDAAIGGRRPVEDVTRLHCEAAREGDVPEDLHSRYREYLAAQEMAQRRRARWAIAGLAAMVLLIAGLATVATLKKRFDRLVEAAVQKIDGLLKVGKIAQLNEAQNFVDQLAAESPRVADAPEVRELREQIGKALEAERVRKESFLREVQRAKESLKDETRDYGALKKASSLASPEFKEETAALGSLEKAFGDLGTEIQQRVDDEFSKKLGSFDGEIAKVEKKIESEPKWCLDELKRIDKALKDLKEAARAGSPGVSPEVLTKADPLQKRIGDGLDQVDKREGQRHFEEQITTVCGDPAQFSRKLLEYAEKYPEDKRSTSFRQVAEETALWKWLADWNDVVQGVGRCSVAQIDRRAAAGHLARLGKLLKDRAGHPDAVAFRRRWEYLKAVAGRVDGDGNPIESPLKRLFADPLVAGAWLVEDKAGHRYYVLQDLGPKLEDVRAVSPSANYAVEYVKGFDFSTKKARSISVSELTCREAPQRKIAVKAALILKDLKDADWESPFCKIVDAISSDEKTDPLLRLALLKQTLELGSKGSPCFEDAAKPYLTALQDAGIPNVNWLDPNGSDEVDKYRSSAKTALAGCASFGEGYKAAYEQWRSVFEPAGWEFRWVGWLHKSGEKWDCLHKSDKSWDDLRARGSPKTQGMLGVVKKVEAAGTEHGGATFQPVGRLDGGEPVIDAAAGDALVEGRPVFLTLPPAK